MSMMGYREYAAHRKAKGLKGGTLRAVQKAITSGRIAVSVDKRIDSADADVRWAATTDQALQRGTPATSTGAVPPATTEPKIFPLLDGVVENAPVTLSPGIDWRAGGWDGPMPPAPPLAERPAVTAAMASVVDLGLYQRSKAEREYAEAQMALDALAKSRGQLLAVDETRKMFTFIGRVYAQGRESLATGLAPRLVGLTDLGEIERRIRATLRETDGRIIDEIRSQYAEVVDGRASAAC
jgi:hypothetical protein